MHRIPRPLLVVVWLVPAAALVARGVVAGDARGLGLLRTTAELVAAALAISLPWGLVLGWCLGSAGPWGRRLAERLLWTLLGVPLVVQAAAWQAGFGFEGWWTRRHGGEAWLQGFWGAAWVHGVSSTVWTAALLAGGFAAVGRMADDPARLELSPLGFLLRVTLRRLAPWIAASAAWTTISVAAEITVTDLYQVRTVAEDVYLELTIGQALEESLTAWWPAACWTALGLALVGWVAARGAPPQRFLPPAGNQPPPTRPHQLLATILLWGSLGVLVAIPLGDLLARAGLVVTSGPSGFERHWSAWKLGRMLLQCPARYAHEAAWSLEIGLLATVLATAAAIGFAGAAWERPRLRIAGLCLAALQLALPGPVLARLVIAVFNHPELPLLNWLYDRSLVPTVLTLALRVFPLTLIVADAGLRTLPRSLWEAARLDGLPLSATVCRVAVPWAGGAILAAALLALALATADVGASILVVPPGVTTVSLRVFNLIHYGVEDQVAAICLVWAALVSLVFSVSRWLVGR